MTEPRVPCLGATILRNAQESVAPPIGQSNSETGNSESQGLNQVRKNIVGIVVSTSHQVVMIVLFLAASLSATYACAQSRAPIDPRVATEITTVDAQIAAAEAENAKYAGGLVKALVESRLATLKQTRAMLAQRATSGDLNVTLRYTVDGKPFALPDGAPAALTAIEGELEGMKKKIAAAEAEAARYPGGLVQAMSLASLATLLRIPPIVISPSTPS